MARYIAPEYDKTPFTCPHCDTLAPQEGGFAGIVTRTMGNFSTRNADDDMHLTYCTSCGKKAVWVRLPDFVALRRRVGIAPSGGPMAATLVTVDVSEGDGDIVPGTPTVVTMVYPRKSEAPAPNEDLPDDILADYREASNVLPHSPRSAAALLRLCVQKLCVHFGEQGNNINDDIGSLVKAGRIRPMVQQAMDVVRIAGNESVHPGTINLDDDKDLALGLFDLVNLIAEEAITMPARVEAMYGKMPASKVDGVARRDSAAGA